MQMIHKLQKSVKSPDLQSYTDYHILRTTVYGITHKKISGILLV